MVKLRYLGKKAPVTINTTAISRPIQFGKDPVPVSDRDAEILMRINPLMFENMGDHEEQPVVVEEGPVVEEEDLVCGKCGKAYKRSGRGPEFYQEHIEKCAGDE